jgi:hypothetical protein
MEEELVRMEEEKAQTRPKIKRSDKEAFAKVRQHFDWVAVMFVMVEGTGLT